MAPRQSTSRARRYWLLKSEPSSYSWDNLVRDKTTYWDGVRNYQARNYLRDELRVGDGVLFYHSNIEPIAIVGVAEVVKKGYPDHTAWDAKNIHYDPKSSPDNPIWYMVDIKPIEKFARPVTLDEIKRTPELANMMLITRGRLSVQPVTQKEWDTICKMGRK